MCDIVSYDALLNTKHKALLLKIERTTSGVNLAVWPVLVTGGDPARPRGSGHSHGKLQRTRAGPGESQAGRAGDTSSTSHIDPRNCAPSPSHISSSDDKVMRKELIFACLSELRRD